MKNKLIIFIALLCLSTACSHNQKPELKNRPVKITYWQFWTGFEEDAIKHLVDKFNKTHTHIKVKMLTISEPWKKTLLSIIGGTPPDILNTTSEWLPELAARGALIPLDDYCKSHMINRNTFISVYWDMLKRKGSIWGLPLTPSSTAIYWNKSLFKKAGLDPNDAPNTLEKLESYADKLTTRDKGGRLIKAGFFPSWPSWASSFYPLIFNGTWGDSNELTPNHPGNIKGWKWAQKFSQKIGPSNIQSFQEEFGNIQGPNNPFYSGKIAIEINGVWEANFISKFAPHIEWGAAPFYNTNGELTTSVICVPIVIPKGAKHPDEAFEFIAWLMKPKNIEELALRQKKFSPLAVSDNETFIKNHPNPYIKAFIDAAKSKNASYFPSTTAFQLYKRLLRKGFEQVMRLEADPKEVLDNIQIKVEKELKRQNKYEEKRDLS